MRRLLIALIVTGVAAVGWARYQSAPPAAEPSLARLMPQGALLFIEGKNFAGLLQDWTSSPEKQAWLTSDNYEVFSRSRLFLRLQAAQNEFAEAAGARPNTSFLSEIAGRRTALGIYDIGKLEMLYITELSSARAMQSGIWQQRSKFEPRQATGEQFFTRTDPKSGRQVAFAVSGDYLILATREDLVAGALLALKGSKTATVDREPWFADAVKQAAQPGDLRMVIHLEEVAKTPHFRTYWIQQNITAMRGYRSSVSDLYRSSKEYREERALLMKNAETSSEDQNGAAELVAFVPPEIGFYAARSAPSADEVLATLEQKVLTPKMGPAPPSQAAPGASLGDGTTGSAANLEERIDLPPATTVAEGNTDQALKAIVRANPALAMLKLHRSEIAPDGVFVSLHSTIVVSGVNAWDEGAVRAALQQVVAPAATTSSIGASWKTHNTAQRAFLALDGLIPLCVAVRGRYLIVSNDPETLDGVLGRMQQKPVAEKSAVYLATFDHDKERQDLYRLIALVDQPNRGNNGGPERTPEFFSGNLASLSRTLGQRLGMESVAIRRSGAIETQTVRYQWLP